MADALLLGIDCGTSVVKAALFDLSGREVAVSQRSTTLLSPQPGWAETDMEHTWSAVVAVIRELVESPAAHAASIEAVGVSGNMIGAWMIDAQGKPVRNAVLWADARTHPLLADLEARTPGLFAHVFESDGCVLESGATLPLIRWFAEHEPAALERASAIFSSKDYVTFRLTGMVQIDPSEAAVLPGNTRTQQLESALFERFGISAYQRLIPPVQPSQAVIGHVLPDVAALTGLRAGLPVVAGAGDVPANAIGIGATEPGQAFTILGTNCQACMTFDAPMFEPADVGLLFYVPGGRWFKALMNVAGTTNVDWFIEQFCAEERLASAASQDMYQRVEALAQSSPVGANGVLYHPYLSTAGVIAPFVEPAARAGFFGLERTHRRADMLRAVYEGVALAVRDCYAVLNRPIHHLILGGGGARSAVWPQLIADCLGAEVVIPQGHEFGAKGAALLAGVGIGLYSDILSAAQQSFHALRTIRPDRSMADTYDSLYAAYKSHQTALRPVWKAASRRP